MNVVAEPLKRQSRIAKAARPLSQRRLLSSSSVVTSCSVRSTARHSLDVEELQLLAVPCLSNWNMAQALGQIGLIAPTWNSAQGLLALAIEPSSPLNATETFTRWPSEVLGGALPTPARMVLGEANEPAAQLLFVVGNAPRVGADPTTRQQRLLEHDDCSTARVRGLEVSLGVSIALSRVRSIRFRRPFSVSSSFKIGPSTGRSRSRVSRRVPRLG
jgi:hypothetical protein